MKRAAEKTRDARGERAAGEADAGAAGGWRYVIDFNRGIIRRRMLEALELAP